MSERWLYEVRGSPQLPFSFPQSDALEKLFSRATTTPVFVDIDMQGVNVNISITSHDLDMMMFGGNGGTVDGWLHRHVDDGDISLGVAFWDGHVYTPYDPQASTLVVDATRFGRKFTTITTGSGDARSLYKITLGSMATQMRMDTMTVRPLYIPPPSQRTKTYSELFSCADYSDEEYSKATEDLPQRLLDIITCPISNDIMRRPVVAADGHSYDERGIMKWLMTRDTSPLTGAQLPHKSLIPNISLYQLIDGLININADAESDGASSTAPPSSPAKAAGKAAAKRALTADEDKAEKGSKKPKGLKK